MSPDYSKAKWVGEDEAPAHKQDPVVVPEQLKAGDLMIVTTKNSELMLRAYASTSAPVIQRMKKGHKVTYLGEKKEISGYTWLKVRWNKLIGWACEKQPGVAYSYLTKA